MKTSPPFIKIRRFSFSYICNIPYWDFNNLREKISPGPGIEPGSPALRAGAITTKPPRQNNNNYKVYESEGSMLLTQRLSRDHSQRSKSNQFPLIL